MRLTKRHCFALAFVALIGSCAVTWPMPLVALIGLSEPRLATKDEVVVLIEAAQKTRTQQKDHFDLSQTKLGAFRTLEDLDQFLTRKSNFENIDYLYHEEGREEVLEALKQTTSTGIVPASNWHGFTVEKPCNRHYNVSSWRDPSKVALQVFGSVWEDCSVPYSGPVPMLKSPNKD
jgi:hypothetical protein